MLSLSRLEAGRGLGKVGTLDAGELLDDLCRVRQPRADAQGIRFETLLPATAIALRGERKRLLLALGNLLDNARDHAPACSLIRLSASIEAGACCFRICDQGAGIPDYALPHLFERFYGLPRPDGSKGSGLGLAIAQEVARLHGGSVTLANYPEGGVEACLRVAVN